MTKTYANRNDAINQKNNVHSINHDQNLYVYITLKSPSQLLTQNNQKLYKN